MSYFGSWAEVGSGPRILFIDAKDKGLGQLDFCVDWGLLCPGEAASAPRELGIYMETKAMAIAGEREEIWLASAKRRYQNRFRALRG